MSQTKVRHNMNLAAAIKDLEIVPPPASLSSITGILKEMDAMVVGNAPKKVSRTLHLESTPVFFSEQQHCTYEPK